MTPCSLSTNIRTPSLPRQSCNPLINTFAEGWGKVKRILDHHTDTISSIGILAVTTGMLAAKIFSGVPAIIGSSGRLFLEFSGIIWLNVQIKEFSKSQRDCMRAIRNADCKTILRTVLKVIIKGMNIFLTCAYFGASVVTFGGFPQVSMTIYMSLRPLSLAILSTEIVNEIWDYVTNKNLLKKLDFIEHQDNSSHQLAKIMRSYLRIILENRNRSMTFAENQISEAKLASAIVGQLDTFTIDQFNLSLKTKSGNSRLKALSIYYNIKDGLANIQDRVKSNLNLTVLGYISRAICKMYPDSLTEMMVRWSMSVIYTDEFVIKYKLRQLDLAKKED